MKQLATCLAILSTSFAFAQPQILNSGFETWQNVGTGTEEPEEWSSIKTSDGGNFINNFAPQVCFQSGDAHTGSYSVNVRTVQSPIGAANGIVTCGRVHAELNPANGRVFTEASDAQWYQVMTSRPDSLVGWYKTTVMTGDYPTVDAIVHTGTGSMPENGTLGNWVGQAGWDGASATVGTWTRFSVPFNYLNGNTPAYVLMVMTSGDSLISQVGTQSWYDDMALIYNVTPAPSDNIAFVTAVLGFPMSVDFSSGGVPDAATDFVAELSDANGDFSNPIIIGTLNTASNSGTIVCEVPAGTPSGTGYLIRVTNASPFYAPLTAGITVDLSTAVADNTVRGSRVWSTAHHLMLDLSGMSTGTVQCEVFDARGARVATANPVGGTTNELSIPNASGLHVVRLTSGSTAEVHRVVLR
ncbi:MAG: hypothetical protein IPJ76_05620 [Flavobacteriales bacterium]|nr:MAG: hypothetical protein IPJ76_05620 [Flavobacteriales bacterium]